MLTIDGSQGEGGGQILRTALGLALASGTEICLENIRAGRAKPGLQPQHLAAVHAAVAVGQAQVEGAELGSQRLLFRPGAVTPGDFSFAIETAGSAPLVLQTVLPALATATGESAIVLEGGTHNPLAPPFEFLSKTYLPVLQQMGPTVRVKLDRYGFYPAGGGKLRVTVSPVLKLAALELLGRGEIVGCRATAIVAHLPRHIAERELKVLKRELGLESRDLRLEDVKSRGPGNVLLAEVESPSVTEVFIAFGELGVKAEVVAGRLAKDVRRYLETGVPVGQYLADQLLVPMALAGGGAFVTMPLSPHATTNLAIIRQFLPVTVAVEPVAEHAVRVELRRSS